MCAEQQSKISVSLQLAGERDVVENGVLAHVVAVCSGTGETLTMWTLSARVLRDAASGEIYLGPMTSPLSMPRELRLRLAGAVERGWLTGRGVEVLDERGDRLMLGALRDHPDGIVHWLRRYERPAS